MGAVAFVKGTKALKHSRANPEDKGKAHAYVGIGCGAIGFLFNLAIVIFLLVILLEGQKH